MTGSYIFDKGENTQVLILNYLYFLIAKMLHYCYLSLKKTKPP